MCFDSLFPKPPDIPDPPPPAAPLPEVGARNIFAPTEDPAEEEIAQAFGLGALKVPAPRVTV